MTSLCLPTSLGDAVSRDGLTEAGTEATCSVRAVAAGGPTGAASLPPTDEAQIQRSFKVALEVIDGNEPFEEDENWPIQVSLFGGTEHKARDFPDGRCFQDIHTFVSALLGYSPVAPSIRSRSKSA